MVPGLAGVDGTNAPRPVAVESGSGSEIVAAGLRGERTARGKTLTRRNATKSHVLVCIHNLANKRLLKVQK